MTTNSVTKLTPWLVLLLAGILYLATLDKGLRPEELTGGDLITHQYAQAQARFSNAPGYPLYTMLGWLWFRAGRILFAWALTPIQILSFYSTLWGLASLWTLYHILKRPDVTGVPLLAALLTLFYAFTYFFWYYSVTTEQYTAAIFQTLLLVWLAFEWEACPQEGEGQRTPGKRQGTNISSRSIRHSSLVIRHSPRRCNALLLLMAFVSGTMAANMLTTLFILPPLLYLIFTRRPDILKNLKLLALTLAAGLLPLLSYAYVYIRGAQHPEWRGAGEWTSTAQWFWQFISTQQGRDELTPGLTLHHLITPEYPSLVWGELGWIVLLGGLAGWLLMGRRKALFFYASLVIYLIFTTLYRFGNWFQVILPLYPLIVVGFGRSVGWMWGKDEGGRRKDEGEREKSSSPLREGLGEGENLAVKTTSSQRAEAVDFPRSTDPLPGPPPKRRRGQILHASLILALLALIIWRFTASVDELKRIGKHNQPTDIGLDPGWTVLADNPPPDASVSGDFKEWVALQYLGQIWGAEPKISLQQPGQPAEYITRRAALAFPQLLDLNKVIPQAVGATLIRLSNTPLTQLPPEATPLNANFGGQMKLVGFQRSAVSGQPSAVSRLHPSAFILHPSAFILYWTADRPLPNAYTVSVRLWQNGQPVRGDDGPLIQDHQPVWNLYPTDKWQPNTLIADAYAFTLPPNAAPDLIQVIVYRQSEDDFENLDDLRFQIDD